MDDQKSNFPKFILLWTGELISAGVLADRYDRRLMMLSGVLLAITALSLYPMKSIRALEETTC